MIKTDPVGGQFPIVEAYFTNQGFLAFTFTPCANDFHNTAIQQS
jgi:hypothetical protein